MGACISTERTNTTYALDDRGNVSFQHQLDHVQPGVDITARLNHAEEKCMKKLRRELAADGIRMAIRREPHVGRNYIRTDGALYTEQRFTMS